MLLHGLYHNQHQQHCAEYLCVGVGRWEGVGRCLDVGRWEGVWVGGKMFGVAQSNQQYIVSIKQQ